MLSTASDADQITCPLFWAPTRGAWKLGGRGGGSSTYLHVRRDWARTEGVQYVSASHVPVPRGVTGPFYSFFF